MSKFHINKHGIPAPCRATKGNCPLGGDESHFGSRAEAQRYIDKQSEVNHGLLPGMNAKVEKVLDKNMSDVLDKGQVHKLNDIMYNYKAKDLDIAYRSIIAAEKRYPDEYNKRMNVANEQYKAITSQHENHLNNSPIGNAVKTAEQNYKNVQKKIEDARAQVDAANSGDCPQCKEGKLVTRKSKYGEFIGCNNFPKCNYVAKPKVINENNVTKQLIKASDERAKAKNAYNKELQSRLENDNNYKEVQSEYQKLKTMKNFAEYAKTDGEKFKKHYLRRKEADEKLEKAIGPNKLVLNSSELSPGINTGLFKDQLSVDREGINNLYLEKDGKISRVINFNNGNINLENGEAADITVTSNWMQRSSVRNARTPSSHNFFVTEKRVNDYDKTVMIKVDEIDSSG